MGRLVRFPSADQMRDRYGSLAGPRRPLPRRWSHARIRFVAVVAWSAIAVASVGLHRATDGAPIEALTALVSDTVAPVLRTVAAGSDRFAATFTLCGGGAHDTCVVDGDTFRLHGLRIRIADIDTPELGPPRCDYERRLGEAARHRLLELLNAGPFGLEGIDRDEDRWGRKLRVVVRGGRSLGGTLVAEGLARRWDGARRGWCG